jgi:hypothetical protein
MTEIHKDRGRHSVIVRNAAPDAAPDGSAANSLPRRSIQDIDIIGDPGWIRTSDHRLRRQVLYPTELRSREKSLTQNPVDSHYAPSCRGPRMRATR